MPDSSIRDARTAVLAERERIQASIRELEEKLAEVDAAVASLDRLIADSGAATARRARSTRGANGRTAGGRPPGRQQTRRTRGGAPTMVSLIEAYLEEQGRKSAHADDVMEHLRAINREPSGKNPKATVQTTLAQLQKRGRIKNIGKNRWRIVRSGAGRRAPAGGGDGTAGSNGTG